MTKPKPRSIILNIFLLLFPFIFQGVREFFADELFNFGEMAFLGIVSELIALLVLALLYGRVYCGILCQIGALQMASNLLGGKVFKKRFVIPERLDRYLRCLKYVPLLLTIVFSISSAKIMFDPYVPSDQYELLFPKATFIIVPIIIAMVLGSFLFNSFFCKYLCVHGALFSLVGRLSIFRLKRNSDRCIGCKLCTKKCPANIGVHTMDRVISKECLACSNCVIACPKKGVLEIFVGTKKIPHYMFYTLGILTYVITVIAVSIGLGAFI